MPTITCYDGVNTIGGNKILLEDGDTCLFFDFGTSFGRRYEFFEEYLKPRPRDPAQDTDTYSHRESRIFCRPPGRRRD